MLIYYRLPGLIASFALVYYTLVVLAIFRLIPVTLTLAGIAGFVLSIGMAVDANILIFERMKEEMRLGKSLPAAVEAGFGRAWNSILDSNVSSLITATILYLFGSSVIRGFALVLIIGVLVSMFSAITVTRTILRVVVTQDWARRACLYGVTEEEFVARGQGRTHACGARRARVFDIIGKRRWYFLISALITIPGLFFIFIAPLASKDAGLQFTIDYTGGTKWEIRFEDPNVTAEQVRAVFAANGLEASVVQTGDGFFEIKTEPIGLRAPRAVADAGPDARPVGQRRGASSSAAAPSALGGAVRRRPRPARRRRAPVAAPSPAQPDASPSASPRSRRPRAVAGASPGASPSPSPPVATGNTELPTDGKLGEMVVALEDALGPIESQRSLTTIGPVVSSDLVKQALILIVVGALGILLWITYRFRDVKFGVTALVALVHDVIVVVGIFAILGTFFHVEIDALFVTAMLTVIGFSVHDTIVVFDRIRENRARHAGEPFAEVVNHSILQTFARSIMTSFTVVLTLLALLPLRRVGDPELRPRPAPRDHLGDVLVDLQRRPDPRRLAGVGRPTARPGRLDPRAADPPRGLLTVAGRPVARSPVAWRRCSRGEAGRGILTS